MLYWCYWNLDCFINSITLSNGDAAPDEEPSSIGLNISFFYKSCCIFSFIGHNLKFVLSLFML